MSRFYVGQRVRCVHSGTGLCQGKEGVVIAVNYSGPRTDGSYIKNGIRIEVSSLSLRVLSEPWRWEPILYDGNQLVSWESMKDLWTPRGVEA